MDPFADIIPHIPEACVRGSCECLCLPCETCNCKHETTVEVTTFADAKSKHLCVNCGEMSR